MKILTITLVLMITSFADPVKLYAQDDETKQIIATLNDYINGRNFGEIDRLRSAFHPTATLKFIDGNTGELKVWQSLDYISNQKQGQKLNCTAEIKSVSYFNDAAQGTIIIEYPNRKYYDYMNLLKVDGNWVIVDKIFTRVDKE